VYDKGNFMALGVKTKSVVLEQLLIEDGGLLFGQSTAE
jgi:hypothetical protein